MARGCVCGDRGAQKEEDGSFEVANVSRFAMTGYPGRESG